MSRASLMFQTQSYMNDARWSGQHIQQHFQHSFKMINRMALTENK